MSNEMLAHVGRVGGSLAVHEVVVQHSQRLLRDGLSLMLEAEDDIEVVGSAEDLEALVTVCRAVQPTVVLLEAMGAGWDPTAVLATLRRRIPGFGNLRVVGVTAGPVSAGRAAEARRAGIDAMLSRADSATDILRAIRNQPGDRRATVARLHASPTGPRPTVVLTARELTILGLVGAGFTSREVSKRLDISGKTVENHKQRIFAKLGVQNQAHAVSVAMRAGILRPDSTIDLAASD